MDVPPPVWIMGQRFTISCKVVDTTILEGFMRPTSCEIEYQVNRSELDRFSPDYLRQLILHEVFHAVDHFIGSRRHIDYGVPGEITTKTYNDGRTVKIQNVRLAECIIESWSQGFYSMVSDPRNQPFFRWLFRDHQMVLPYPHPERSEP